MNLLKLACFLVLASFFHQSANGQDWVSYQSQQQINDLVDTGNELLMATDAGLVVMNKATLEKTIFNKGNSGLTNNHIMTIAQGADGSTWVGTYDVVLGRFDGTDFQDITIPQSDALTQNTVLYDLEIAPNGDLWLGTSDGVFQRQGQEWLHYDKEELGQAFFQAWDIEINSAGEVFVASHTIHKYVDGEWSNISDATVLSAYLGAELFFSQSGDLYFAGDLERVGRFDGGNWQIFEISDPGDFDIQVPGQEIIGFTEDEDGSVYLNTRGAGIFKLENDTWTQQADAQTAAFQDQTSYFYIDEQNDRWLNHNIYLSVNRNGNLQTASLSQHSLEYNNVYRVRKGADGRLFFITASTSTKSIAVLDSDGSWSSLTLPFVELPLLWGPIADILHLADDDIWLSSYNGLHHYNGNEWLHYELLPCHSLAVDAQGKIYARALDRIYIVESNGITEYNTDNSPLATGIISGHGVDPEGNLWIAAFDDDVIQKVSADGEWTTYTAVDHPAIQTPSGDFHFDGDGNVWIPDDVAGVIKFDGETWTNPIIDNISDIANLTVLSIESDEAGKLYFAHQYGLTTLFEGEWEHLVIEDVPSVNSSHRSSIEFDDQGTLWWASNRYGVFSYTPESPSALFSQPVHEAILAIYPNPTSGLLHLDIPNNLEWTIVNFSGQVMMSGRGTSCDLSRLPNGMYLIKANGRVAKVVVE